MPESVYCRSRQGDVVVTARSGAEIAVAGGPSKAGFPAFRVPPEKVEQVEVGSSKTHSHRLLHHILGENQDGRVDRLIVSERFTTPGCWAGYPPHKHGTARDGESAHDELYHYRFKPENGFGAQYWYDDHRNSEVFMTRQGDTFVFAYGYHPTVQSPGHMEYCFTILLGQDQRSLVQYLQDQYRYMMNDFPCITTIIERYK
jgi:5-deoxy-glucuronate isomerase